MRIDVVVDEVVLHDVDPRDRHRVRDAIEHQMRTRLAHASVADRIRRNAKGREQIISGVVSESVRAAIAAPALRRG
jgi:hypothetical protein